MSPGPLAGFSFLEVGQTPSVAYAGRLLVLLGAQVLKAASDPPWQAVLDEGKHLLVGPWPPERLAGLPVAGALECTGALAGRAPFPVVGTKADPPPEEDWAASGAMALTGWPEQPPELAPGPLAAFMRGAALAARLLARCLAEGSSWAPQADPLADLDGPSLLGERAALAGLGRQGRRSPGGGCRLIACHDGWLAASLVRPADAELLEAWTGTSASEGEGVWEALAGVARRLSVDQLVERGRLLGLPVAPCLPPEAAFADEQARARGQGLPPSPYLVQGPAPSPGCRPGQLRPLVADLSCLWAGPLAGSLLARCGASVVKVESWARPDGARRGPRAFFDLLNANKRSLALDLGSSVGRDALARLVEAADLVIESSRPRAAEQLGLEPGRTGWLSITGYGRSGPGRDWVAFGDDASAAAGLPALTGGAGAPLFCGDALADPAAGLHATVAGLALLLARSCQLVEVSLREVVGHMLIGARPQFPEPGSLPPAAPPRARRPPSPGPGLGQHNEPVLAWLGCRSVRSLR